MKLIILRLNTANKLSPMSKGVAKIRINNQPWKGINLTTQHTWAMEATRVETVHDAIKESGWVLPHPSVVFNVYASADTPWVAQKLSHCTLMKWGKVSSNPLTHEATNFGDSICPICVSTFKCLFIRAQSTWTLTDIGEGYHLGAPNFRSDHSHSFPSSILPFPRPVFNYSNILIILLNHIGPPSIERVLSQVDSNHSTSTVAYTTKHSMLSLSFFHRCKQSSLVRMFWVQLGFHQTFLLQCTIMA
jgi:hypothetical protein